MARIGIDKDRLQTPQGVMQSAVNKAATEAGRANDPTNTTYKQEGATKRKESPLSLQNGSYDYWLAQRQKQGAGGGMTQDPNAAQANALYQQLMNRGDFKYDLQGDMLYRQYADQYSMLGQQAMQDVMGTAAGLTGGYGNSWAGTMGAQAYQQYLGQLNAMVPDFYDRAYQVWLNEGDDLLMRYQLAQERAAAGRGGSGAGTAEPTVTEELPADDGAYADAYAAFLNSRLPATPFEGQIVAPVFDPDYYDAYLKKNGK